MSATLSIVDPDDAAHGVRRDGFPDLSRAHLMEARLRPGDPAATTGRVSLPQLGDGAILTAGCNVRSIATAAPRTTR
ncbi:MAG: hypothetical protein ABIN44_08285 [Burkholderiaceae bacterium]